MLLPLPPSTVTHVDDGRRPTKDIYNWLKSIYDAVTRLVRPQASATPSLVGELVIEATSNTTLTLKYKGTDGTIRSVALTLT